MSQQPTLECLPIQQLSAADSQRWIALQRTAPAMDSPFLHPEFSRLAHQVFGDVECAVWRGPTGSTGFFPFRRLGRKVAAPVAPGLTEWQARIGLGDWQVEDLLRHGHLQTLHFDHFVDQAAMEPYFMRVGVSPYADLRAGFGEYCRSRQSAGSRTIKEVLRKERKLQRDYPDARFEMHCLRDATFSCLLRWKSEQHRRTEVPDIFQDKRVTRFLQLVRGADSEGMRGTMSVLTAGGAPIAVHLGIRTQRVAHVWYPAFDRRWASYSPGLILLLRWLEELAGDGVERVDFGPGQQRYKQSFRSADLPVGWGVADRSSVRHRARRIVRSVKQSVKRLPLFGNDGGPTDLPTPNSPAS